MTQQELLYQHAGVAQQMGTVIGVEGGPRERDAATFHLRRAARKLALAQVKETDEQVPEVYVHFEKVPTDTFFHSHR